MTTKAIDTVTFKPRQVLIAFAIVEFFCLLAVLSFPDLSYDLVARFGAVIVCVAVFFVGAGRFSLDWNEKHWVRIYTRNYEETRARHAELEDKLASQFGDRDDYVEMVRRENREFLSTLDPTELEQKIFGLRTKFFLTDLFVLMIGTLQWAFGDWVLAWFICGAVHCPEV